MKERDDDKRDVLRPPFSPQGKEDGYRVMRRLTLADMTVEVVPVFPEDEVSDEIRSKLAARMEAIIEREWQRLSPPAPKPTVRPPKPKPWRGFLDYTCAS